MSGSMWTRGGLPRRGVRWAVIVLGSASCRGDGAAVGGGEAIQSWSVSTVPTLEVGELDGVREYLFEQIRDVRLLPDGRVLVADGGMKQIRTYDVDGTFVHGFGREGEGPGEFADLSSVWFSAPDTLHVWDNENVRVTSFLTDGTMLAGTRLRPEGRVPERGLGRLPDGGYAILWVGLGEDDGRGIHADVVSVDRFGADGRFIARAVPGVGFHRYMSEAGSGPIPFSPRAHTLLRGDTLFFANGLAPGVVMLSLAGDTIGTIPLPESPADVGAAWSALETELRAGEFEWQRSRLESMPRFDIMPGISAMLMDDEGYLWVKPFDPVRDHTFSMTRGGDEGGQWQVLDRSGSVVQSLTMPPTFVPFEVRGSRIVGLTRDELGVERVAVHAILGRG